MKKSVFNFCGFFRRWSCQNLNIIEKMKIPLKQSGTDCLWALSENTTRKNNRFIHV